MPDGWTEKECPGCHKVCPRAMFGTQSRCKPCVAAYYQDNKERIRARRQQWYRRNKEEQIKYASEWKKRNPDKLRDYQLKAKYGIPYGTYGQLLKKQRGRCAICKVPHPKTLHVDHDHKTGKVRALLCDPCNRGVGYFAEDPRRLRAAATYLERHR